MGLLLKYILEKQYEIQILFSADIILDSQPFSFSDLGKRRNEIALARNNGRIRCTVNSDADCFVQGEGWFKGMVWKECHLALTNIGVFLYNSKELAAKQPEFIWINELSFEMIRGKLEGKDYCIQFKQNCVQKWQVSVRTNQIWRDWEKKTKEMIELYSEKRGQILYA
jgi:hypothetical protein